MLTKFLQIYFKRFFQSDTDVKDKVEYSMTKYHKTYKLLEEYDKKSVKDPNTLAEPGDMRKYLQKFQRSASI